MAYSFRSVGSGSTEIFFSEKVSEKSAYLVGILLGGWFYFKTVIWVSCKEWIVILNSRVFRALTCITKVFDSLSNAVLANSF